MSSNNTDAFDNLMNEYLPMEGVEASSGNDTPASEVEVPEAEDEVANEADTTEEAEPVEGEEAAEAVDEESEEADEEPKPKGKKTAQERIAEVVAKQRAAERERDAERAEKADLLRRLEALEKGSKPEVNTEITQPAGAEFGLIEPTADDLDDNGEPKYPLGSFDPNFMRDINRYDRAVERAYEEKTRKETEAQTTAQQEEQKLFEEWNAKLTEAEKTSPKIREKAQELVDTFTDAEPEHIQTIAATIMTLDNGPSVLEYLADNLDEADKLVKMSTQRALLQLGRLDGLFIEDAPEAALSVKPTSAPRPPVSATRGSGGRGRETVNSLYDKMLKDFR